MLPVRGIHLRAVISIVAVVALTWIFLWGVEGAAAVSDEATWAVRPVSSETQPHRDNFAIQAPPGAIITDALTITNYGDSDLTLAVYAADGFTTSSGQLDVLPRSETSEKLGVWITLDESDVTLTPGQTMDVPFTLSIPDDASPGDYTAAVVTSLTSRSENSMVVDRRLGIRVQLRVEGPLKPQLTILNARLDYIGNLNPFDAGTATATYTVRNDGNTRLSAAQNLTVSGPFGLAPLVVAADSIPELLPGEAWEVQQKVATVLPLFWITATVSITPLAPAEYSSSDKATNQSVTIGTWAMPWSQLLILIGLALVSARSVSVRRRRRARQQALIDNAVSEALARADEHAQEKNASDLPSIDPASAPHLSSNT